MYKRQVITNLLSNAIKFTPDNGEISVYIATLPTKESKEVLYLCVSDSGTGIPEQDIEQIFNRFYQSKKQVKYPVSVSYTHLMSFPRIDWEKGNVFQIDCSP